MEFEWDEAKSEQCRKGRGFSFVDVLPAFSDPARMIEPDRRYEYGEERFCLYGSIEKRLFVVIYTVRRETIRIISARKANKRERKRYGDRQSSAER